MLDTGQILRKCHFFSHPVLAEAPLASSFSEDLSSGKQGNLVILSSINSGSSSFPGGRGSSLRSLSSFGSRVTAP